MHSSLVGFRRFRRRQSIDVCGTCLSSGTWVRYAASNKSHATWAAHVSARLQDVSEVRIAESVMKHSNRAARSGNVEFSPDSIRIHAELSRTVDVEMGRLQRDGAARNQSATMLCAHPVHAVHGPWAVGCYRLLLPVTEHSSPHVLGCTVHVGQ